MDREETFNAWLLMAIDDLEHAEEHVAHNTRYSFVPVLCEQALEKLAKGLYWYYVEDHAPYTHSISAVVRRMSDRLPEPVGETVYSFFDFLTRSYTQSRYPDMRNRIPSCTREEAAECLEKTEVYFEWLLSLKQ